MSTQAEFEVLDNMDASLGIAEVARLSGLSQDTLRWYEREGLLPAVRRGPDRRRRYTRRDAALVEMLAKLRDSGMPTGEMSRSSKRGRRPRQLTLGNCMRNRLKSADEEEPGQRVPISHGHTPFPEPWW